MRFIIVTQTFPPRIGGMQNVMESLAKKLSLVNETIVLPDHAIPKNHSILKTKINFHFSNFPKIIRGIIKKLKLKKILLPDDIIICDSWKSVSAIPLCKNKIIILAHGQEYLSKKKYFKIKKALKRINKIICNSNYTKGLILKNYNIKETDLCFVPPTYSIDKNSNNYKKIIKKKDYVDLVTISRLEERKGYLNVLDALGFLVKKNILKNFKWKIFGEGPLKEKLDYKIKKLNLSQHVILLGKILNKEKLKVLKDADLFVMPSYRVKNSIEGFGISYIEAAKFGVPSISGIDGGVVDAVINNKTGWNINPLNKKQLEATLIKAINNHKKREEYGYNAKKYFHNNLTGNKAFEKFLKIIMS